MHISESIKMATGALMNNRLRTSLTMLGMIIGNAAVIAMVGVGQGAQNYATSQLESLGPNVLFISPGNEQTPRNPGQSAKPLVLNDAQAIADQVPTVAQVAPQLQETLPVVYGSNTATVQVMGTNAAYPIVRNHDIAQGRFINELDIQQRNLVAVIGSDLAQRLFGTENPVGQQLRIKNLSFRVIGLMESKGAVGTSNQDDLIFVPISTMANRLVGQNSPFGTELSMIAVTAKDSDSISAAEFQIQNLLRLRHKVTGDDDFTIYTQQQTLELISNVGTALTLMLGAIASISLLVGGIGVMNIMLVSATERTQEIGLRKAIGASQFDILIQFLIEAIILSAIGGLLGTAIGVGSTLLVGVLTPLETGISVPAVVLTVGMSSGIGLFFGVIPAKQAAEMDPILALKGA